ncbi:MAG: hypothetical protein AAB319_06425, partial [Pseudomonadota bacterium]
LEQLGFVTPAVSADRGAQLRVGHRGVFCVRQTFSPAFFLRRQAILLPNRQHNNSVGMAKIRAWIIYFFMALIALVAIGKQGFNPGATGVFPGR